MISFPRRCLESEFARWLKEPIYTSYGIDVAPRQHTLWMLIEDIRDFLGKEGYVFRENEKTMTLTWARYLFRLQKNLLSKTQFQGNPDDSIEDFDMYCHLFDQDRWTQFLSNWKWCDDFARNHRGSLALEMIPLFAWHFVDISTSGPTRIVDEMNEDSDSDADEKHTRRKPKSAYDPYYEDQSNATSKFNRWD